MKKSLVLISLIFIFGFIGFVSAIENFNYKIGNGDFEVVGYGGMTSIKLAEIYPSTKGLQFNLVSRLKETIYNFHLDIEGCNSFDYSKPVNPGEYFGIGGTREMPLLPCSIFATTNNKTIQISYIDKNNNKHIVTGWIYFTIPEAQPILECHEIPAEKIVSDTNCRDKLQGYVTALMENQNVLNNPAYTPTISNYKQIIEDLNSSIFKSLCYSPSDKMLYYIPSDIYYMNGGMGGIPYAGGSGVVYYKTSREGLVTWQVSGNVCNSSREIRTSKCANTLEGMDGNYDILPCEESTVCETGKCVDAGACIAEIKFEASGGIIAPDHFPTVFIRTYDKQGNKIESLIISEEYFNSQKEGESIMRIPKEGFKTGGLEREKFEPGNYKIVLKSPVAGCDAEETIEFTIKESMSMFDRISELFRWIF